MEKIYHENNDGSINVSCTYKQDEYAPIAHKAQVALCNEVKVDGFRKGKAPLDVAIRYVKPEDIYNRMINKLIDKDFNFLLDGYDVSKVANIHPNLSVNFNDKDKTYNLLYTFYLLPTAEIKQSTNLGIKVEPKQVSDEDVDNKINSLLVDNAELVPAKETDVAENGDHVILDFTGYVDGKEFDGGSANDYELVLGSHSFVPGFEEQLVGLKANERKTIDVTFPENYVESLKGKLAKFAVCIKSIKKVSKPELNDDFASSLDTYKVKTVDELKKAIKDELVKQAEEASKTEKLNKVLELIEKDAKVTIHPKYIEFIASRIKNQQIQNFKQYGLTLADYVKLTGISEAQLDQNCSTQAKADATRFAVLSAVGKANKLEVSQEDLENYFGGKEKFDNLMKTAKEGENKNPDFSLEAYMDNIKQQLLDKKVQDFLVSNN